MSRDHEQQTETTNVSHAPMKHPAARRGHGHVCPCSDCVLSRDLRDAQTRVVRDAPTGSLPSQSVSLQELVDNATLTQPCYSVGEDWNDD